MPPLSAYTPFESLLFVQSLAALDSRPTSFASISNVLRNNPFIRQNVSFNAERLSPEALEELYAALMRDGLATDGAHRVSSVDLHGHPTDSPESNSPKRRKISSPRSDGLADGVSHTTFVPKLVSRLYATYKELVTREIRSEEKRYDEIIREIEQLQREEREVPRQDAVEPPIQQVPVSASLAATKLESAPEPMDVDVREDKPVPQPTKEIVTPPVGQVLGAGAGEPQEERGKEINVAQQPAHAVGASPTQGLKYPAAQPLGLPNQAAAVQPSHPISVPFNGNGNLSSQPISDRQHTPANKETPKISPVNQVQSPTVPYAAPSRTLTVPHPQPAQVSSKTTAQPSTPRGKHALKEGPLAVTPVTAPLYPHGQPSFHQWNLNQPPQVPYPQTSPYPATPQPNRPFPGQPSISPYPPQTAQPQVGRVYPGQYHPPILPATPVQVPGAVQHPLSDAQRYETPRVTGQAIPVFDSRERPSQPFTPVSGTLTPWKKLPRLSIPESPRSPPRPRPEDISPISERAPSPIGIPEVTSEKVEAWKCRSVEPKGRKRSRVRSAKTPDVDSKSTVNVKPEKPSSLRKRRDGSTPSSRSVASRDGKSPGPVSHGRIKYEAVNPEDNEPEPRVVSRRRGPTISAPADDQPARGRPKRKRGASEELEAEHVQTEPNRPDALCAPGYVLCTRNFPRTGAPIMNDVATHKHASIFTKPLTERDAPGYRDLIYRPQDMKSIKSAIHHGSKAVAAATEAASTPVTDGESPAPSAGATPSKNAVLMLQKMEDIIPPKGIVNSSQLEKELIRMFANAVMFNPIPQRGFGPAFPMTGDHGPGRHYYPQASPEVEEGGIIKDTVEMFNDVEEAVTKWRAAERTAEELANKSIVSIRKGSVGDLNADSADEVNG